MSSLNVSGAFVYFVIPILGGIPITQTTVSSLIVTIVLIVLSIRLGKNLQKRPTGVQVLVEKGVSMLYGMVAETMGEHNLYWTPFIGTIFLSSILGSLIGMTGFLRSMTADLSCTLVWAVLVSVLIWYNNIKNNGKAGVRIEAGNKTLTDMSIAGGSIHDNTEEAVKVVSGKLNNFDIENVKMHRNGGESSILIDATVNTGSITDCKIRPNSNAKAVKGSGKLTDMWINGNQYKGSSADPVELTHSENTITYGSNAGLGV